MGLNGISAWQWVFLLVIFVVAIAVAPGLARFRRGQEKGKADARPEDDDNIGDK